MPLLNVVADFERMVAVLERIDLHLAHGLRILETAFPLDAAAARWSTPSNDLHVVGDETLLEREADEARQAGTTPPVVSELGDENVAPGYDVWNLEAKP